jgi:hypothetical protein
MSRSTFLRCLIAAGLLGTNICAAQPLTVRLQRWLSTASETGGACGAIEWSKVQVLGAAEQNGATTLNLATGFFNLGDTAVRDQAVRCLAAALPPSAGVQRLAIQIDGAPLPLSIQHPTAPSATASSAAPRGFRIVLNAAGGRLSDGTTAVEGMDGSANARTAMSMLHLLARPGAEVIPTRQSDTHTTAWAESASTYLQSQGVDDAVLTHGATAGERDTASRALYANSLNAQRLLTVDAGGPNRTLRIFYSPDGSNAATNREFALSLHENLLSALRQIHDATWNDGGVIACSACSIENRLAAMPAAFVEIGGGSTPAAASSRFQMAAGSAVARVMKPMASTADAAAAAISSPTPGSTLTGSSATFGWNAVSGATDYYLMVGDWVGGDTLSIGGVQTVFAFDAGTATSYPVTGLPTDGRTLHVRLFSCVSSTCTSTSGWVSNDATYTAYASAGVVATPAQITAPTPGSTLTSSTATFTWNAGTAVADYYLFVGKWAGDNSLFSADVAGLSSQQVTGLPSDGTLLYVRLWSYINGVWQSNDYTYTCANTVGPPVPASIVTPTPSSTLAGSSVSFTWSKGTTVARYWLQVGYWLGGDTLESKDEITATSDTVNGIPTDGRDIYVRIWSYINGNWQSTDAMFVASTLSGTPTKATITSPAASSVLNSGANTITWGGGIGVSAYYLFVGTTVGGSDVYSRNEGTALDDTVTLPANKTIFVRIWSYINGAYSASDVVYTTGN